MTFHDRRQKRRRPVNPLEGLTPEQLARAHEEAVHWRALLRSGASLPADEPVTVAMPVDTTSAPRAEEWDAQRRARFATAIARAEFGRFYRDSRPADTKPGPSGRKDHNGNGRA